MTVLGSDGVPIEAPQCSQNLIPVLFSPPQCSQKADDALGFGGGGGGALISFNGLMVGFCVGIIGVVIGSETIFGSVWSTDSEEYGEAFDRNEMTVNSAITPKMTGL